MLLGECRDVVFQSSPFPGADFHVYAENETIGASHFARRWFQLTYGGSVWRELRTRPFLCSGTTINPVPAILSYLEVLTRELGRIMANGGKNQAVHNYVIHRGLVPAVIALFGEGRGITLNAVAAGQLRLEAGRLMDAAGRPFPIVHQYDRVPGLAGRLAGATAAES